MKTLKQILLEQKQLKLTTINPATFQREIAALGSPKQVSAIEKLDIEQIERFKIPFNRPIEIGTGETLDGSKIEDAIKFYQFHNDGDSTYESWKNLPILVRQGKGKNWYFVILTANNKDIINNLESRDLIVKSKNNPYYYLPGVPAALEKSVTAKQTQQQTAKSEKENRQKWNDWIPQKDFEKDDRNYDIDKIRKLIGLTGKNDTFDDTLETNLKAWQKQFRIPVTGKWDNASQEKAIQILQDRPYRNLNAEIETYSALKKPIAKDTLSTSLNDLVALAKNYRQWANTTSDLKSRYGSKSDYELNSTYVKPANDYFKKSYAAGREEFEAAGGMGKKFVATVDSDEYSKKKGSGEAWGKLGKK
jgi:hypothetical protein